MSSVYPKIGYTPPGGSPTSFVFQYPPRNTEYWCAEYVRHDNVASSGVKESVYERRDEFLEFDMPYVGSGADAAAWQAFLETVGQGIPFDFYPDWTSATHDTYTMEMSEVKLGWVAPGVWKLMGLRFRKRVPWP